MHVHTAYVSDGGPLHSRQSDGLVAGVHAQRTGGAEGSGQLDLSAALRHRHLHAVVQHFLCYSGRH